MKYLGWALLLLSVSAFCFCLAHFERNQRRDVEAAVYTEGMQARTAGVPAVANPYAARRWGDDHRLEVQWLKGWMAGGSGKGVRDESGTGAKTRP
jgi:hypothetical protein